MNKKLSIAYVNYFNLPSYHAHSIQIMEMCNALNKYANTELIVPFFAVHNVYPKDLFKYYGVDPFPIKRIYVPDFLFLGIRLRFFSSVFMHIHMLFFSIASLFYILLSNKRYDAIYTRNPYVAFVFSFLKTKKVVYEVHNLHPSMIFFILDRVVSKRKNVLWIFVPYYLGFIYSYLFSLDKFFVLPNAVNLNRYKRIVNESKFKDDIVRVGYIGSINEAYIDGIKTMLSASKYFEDNVVFYIIGVKNKKDVINMGKLYSNVIILERVPHKEVVRYINLMDILILPLSFKGIRKFYPLPLKLFEYMASKKCIIASDLPSIRAVVSDKEVFFYNPQSVDDLINKVLYIIRNKKECKDKSYNAYKLVKEKYTYDVRAKKIINLLKT